MFLVMHTRSGTAYTLPQTVTTEQEAVEYMTRNGHTDFKVFQEIGTYKKKVEVVKVDEEMMNNG